MSVEIRFKDGMPLMTAGGLIAGSDKCCCENPPPPLCGCADYCPYIVEVTSPSGLAVKSPPAFCDGTGGFASRNPAAALTNFGCSPSGWEYIPPVGYEPTDESVARVSLNGDNVRIGIASVVAQELGTFTKKFPNQYFPSGTMDYYVGGRVLCSIQIYCDRYGEQGPPSGGYFAIARFIAYFAIGNSLFYRWHQRGKEIGFELPSYCSAPGQRVCGDVGSSRVRYLNLPANITVGGLTTSAGNYTADGVVYSSLEQIEEFAGQEVVDYIDCVIAAATATFRITSRPKCDSPVACNCAAPLGGMYVDLGNLISATSSSTSEYQVNSSLVDFVWMYDRSDETVSWQGPFGFYEYDQNDPDGPQDGNGKFTRRLWRQRAELYCDVIDGVAQWFVLFTSFRDIYDEAGTSTHRSYDEWVGKINCFQACEDLDNYIAADEPVPMGEPYDIEYLGRTTEAGYLECEPPPRLTIRFTQVNTC